MISAGVVNASIPAASVRSVPALASKAQQLAEVLKNKSKADLKVLCEVSDNLAGHVKQLYEQFSVQDHTSLIGASRSIEKKGQKSVEGSDESRYAQAACMYNGPAYQGLNMKALNKNPLWAANCQRHVRVLSGLYGSVRPGDQIQEYRLCMGSKLVIAGTDGTKHNSLYEFWGDSIAASIASDLTEQLAELRDPPAAAYLVNCASQEYFKSIQPYLPEQVEVPASSSKGSSKAKKGVKGADAGNTRPLVVIECVFLDQGMIKSTFAKRARGLMAKFLSLHYRAGADVPVLLRQFDLEGYCYSSSKSSELTVVFDRKTPSKPDNGDTIAVMGASAMEGIGAGAGAGADGMEAVDAPAAAVAKKRKR